MLTDKGIDTGDMLLRTETPIHEDDTAGTLLIRLSEMGANLLVETIKHLEQGDCPREKQNEALMTYDPKLEKEMGALDFTESTRRCLCRVRAMNPWPCASAALDGGVLKVWRATAFQCTTMAVPGTVLYADTKHGLVIATGDGAMELLDVQAPNARRMEAQAYLLGHTLEAGKPLSEVKV